MSKKTGPGIYNLTIEHCDESSVRERTLAQGGAAGAQWSQTQITVLSMFTTAHVLQILREKIFTTDILRSILD